jgi:hypothetical protein
MLMTARTLSVAALLAIASPALAQEHDHHNETPPSGHHGEHDAPHAHGLSVLKEGHAAHAMTGALGPYAMGREASGTSWQPDVSEHGGVHGEAGGWKIMHHALLNAVYGWQDGPRGDEKTFVSGMLMASARRDLAGGDALNLRLMLSPDAFSGKRGYPLLLAAGETADGVTPLVDRQHPHELLMEASVSYAHKLSATESLFLYAGLPGEPAFGPPAFMHRLSAMDSPEAPISHHWLDSTHITFGVLSAGYVHDGWKLEVSGFRGREPDQDRFDIEDPELDSTAVRVSWNPTKNWSLQASWADVESPEQLHPDEDEDRYSASAIHTVERAQGGWWSTTAAFGRKERSDGAELNAGSLETALKLASPWTLFARAEVIESDELGLVHDAVSTVGKASLGAIRDFRVHEHAVIGVGGLVSKNFTDDLDARYGGDPEGAMAFVRLKIG